MKLTTTGDKKQLFQIIGVMLAAMTAVFGAAYYSTMVQGKGLATPQPVASRPNSTQSPIEGNVEYNKTFQEKLLSSVQTQMEELRRQNKLTIDAMREESKNRDDALVRQVNEAVQASQQQAPQSQPARVTASVSAPTTVSTRGNQSGVDVPFLGSPADVKPGSSDASATSTSVPSLKGSTKSEPNIAPNGIVEGRTLNGVVAVAGAQPSTIMVKLEGRYLNANGHVANLDGCVVYAEGRANIPSGRVMGKPARMTCNFQDHSSKTWDVSGTIMDEDGVEGIAGVLVDNAGKKFAGAAAAGAVAIAGNTLSRSQTQTFSGPAGASTAFTGSVGTDVAGGILQGAGNEVSKQMQDYYNQYASSVQTGAGHKVTVVLLDELIVPESGREITQTRSIPNSGVFK
jgi:conjugal transfer pilus assembly protein TraB